VLESMIDSRELAALLLDLHRRAGSVSYEDRPDLVEDFGDFIEVDYDSIDVETLDMAIRFDKKFWGLDASIRTLRVTGIDIVIATGALVGKTVLTVPGPVRTRWIAVRPRYAVDDETREILRKCSDQFYTCSRFTDDVFDGTYSEDTLKDEVRISVENELLRYWDGSDYLIIDGPLFPLPRILSRPESRYGKVYLGLIRERMSVIKERNLERKVVCVVKRLSHSRYLANIVGSGSTDDHVALMMARDLLDRSERMCVYIGTLRICLRYGTETYVKYAGYIVKRIGHVRHVIRIETADEETLHDLKHYVASLLDVTGLPRPVDLADRICKRLASSAYIYLWGIVPLDPTYESYEELRQAELYLRS